MDGTPKTGTLLTVGHGTKDRNELGDLLADHGIRGLVDVRRFPASRRNPDVARDVLADRLPGRHIGYRWEERLGGRRRLPAGADQPDSWWRVEQFRAYAAHTRTSEFVEALDRLLAQVATEPVAIMCSESLWWRCHRRLIADVAVLARNVPVQHIMPNGDLRAHQPASGARVRSDGLLIWDGGS